MAVQIAELRRCPTCNRWGGKRSVGADGISVELDSEDNRGPCREGPWHGSSRGPRNACGQWLRWVEIKPVDEEPKQLSASGPGAKTTPATGSGSTPAPASEPGQAEATAAAGNNAASPA